MGSPETDLHSGYNLDAWNDYFALDLLHASLNPKNKKTLLNEVQKS